MIFPAGTGICSGGNAYRCFFAGGVEYFGRPDSGPNDGNAISSTGFALATTRVLAGFDYLIKPWISAGIRVGWAFNGVPSGFKPYHLEARGVWWILKRSAKPGFRPYVLLSSGMAEVDGRLSVNIKQSAAQSNCKDNDGNPVNCPRFAARPVDAWRAGGLVFISPGVGAMYQFKPRWGAYLELKMAYMFPTTSLTGAAQLGGSFGF
jgi:hypothetical protein